MTQSVHNLFTKALLLTVAVAFAFLANGQAAPELVFRNAVLKSGNANKEGAVYRFSNVTSGVDAEIKLKKFSRNDIYMKTVDNSALGWDKAFQPEFGLQGLVLPNQNWYVDFEMSFYEAGTNKKKKVTKADMTALDVDGDGNSIAEYAVFDQPSAITFSTVTNLLSAPAGSIGQSLPCGLCAGLSSPLAMCSHCNGTGTTGGNECSHCDGSGALHSACQHPFEGIIGNILQGPVANFNNIDTSATQVMAIYQYQNTERIKFRYGAKSGALSSNGSGVRMNSLWAKSFNLAPLPLLPVNFTSFTAFVQKGDAVLNWNTTADEKLNHFIVQRSTNGVDYADIATVFAGASMAYNYKDKGVTSATGVVYYRIVAVDGVKETRLSTTKMIRLTNNETAALNITAFPNPVVNELRLTLPATWQGKTVNAEIYRTDGALVKAVQFAAAGQTETVAVNGLTKGNYVVKASFGTEVAAQRIVKN